MIEFKLPKDYKIMQESEGGYLSLGMPMHIAPIVKESDEFTGAEPLFLQGLSLSKSNSQVPKAMIKNRTSFKTPLQSKMPL